MIKTCSSVTPSFTHSSPLSDAVSLFSVEGGGGFLPIFGPKCSSGFGALSRESLAGLIALFLDAFRSSVFLDLNRQTKKTILMPTEDT